jgi:hypothetical protein
MRSPFAPFRRAPQSQPKSIGPPSMPATGPRLRQYATPLISTQSHSPSSGMRGRTCRQRCVPQEKRLALRLRSSHTRSDPIPPHRQPSRGAAVFGTARRTTSDFDPRQHTRCAPTSAQTSPSAFASGAT